MSGGFILFNSYGARPSGRTDDARRVGPSPVSGHGEAGFSPSAARLANPFPKVTTMPKPKSAGASALRQRRAFARAAIEQTLLRMIRHAIRYKQPCPTNEEFALAAGLADANAASYRLRRLVYFGKIEVIHHGPFERRQVVLKETGQITKRAEL